MSGKLLEITNLKTYFSTEFEVVKAVDGISLDMERGETVGIVGESGSGKSTLAFSITRLLPPYAIVSGEISFKGKNVLETTKKAMRHLRGKEISMIFQDPLSFLNPVLRVEDQISEVISLHQAVSGAEVKEKVVEVLSNMQIPSPKKVAKYYPHQLSGGMGQRVVIAIATSCNPSLLIADEPTTALDVTVQAQILDLMHRLKENSKSSILLVTHDLGIVAEMCDRVYIMYAGKILEYGDIFQIFENPKHPYTSGLLKSILSIDEFKRTIVAIEGSVPSTVNPPTGCRFQPRCPQAKAICSGQEPPFVQIESGHEVSCWLYH